MRVLIALALATSIAFAPNGASAYRTAGDTPGFEMSPRVRWHRQSFALRGQVSTVSGLALPVFEAAVRRGVDAWSAAHCDVEIQLMVAGWQETGAVHGDGRITIAWVSDWTAQGYESTKAATTDIVYERDEVGRWWIVDAVER